MGADGAVGPRAAPLHATVAAATIIIHNWMVMRISILDQSQFGELSFE
jgi:hypothetical protein